MITVARFEHVSPHIFAEAWQKAASSFSGPEPDPSRIPLPRRATAGSAGYDFFAPAAFTLSAGESILIPTGIRAIISEGWFLALFPRSGLGFRYRLQLDNTVGIIDSDYSHSENEGHILIRLTCDSKDHKTLSVPAGAAVAQGIFLPYGITDDDDATADRNGGFGSTDSRKVR